jgi:hypothetical protein
LLTLPEALLEALALALPEVLVLPKAPTIPKALTFLKALMLPRLADAHPRCRRSPRR